MSVLRIFPSAVKDRTHVPRSKWLDLFPRIQYLIRWMRQGFPDSDIWDLDWSIATYILPRLKRLKEMQQGVPGDCENVEEWHGIMNKMIAAFEKIVNKGSYYLEGDKEVEEGLDLFRKYYFCLWD